MLRFNGVFLDQLDLDVEMDDNHFWREEAVAVSHVMPSISPTTHCSQFKTCFILSLGHAKHV